MPGRWIAAIAAAATLALASGCGSDDDETTTTTSAPAGEGSALAITLDADGPGGEEPSTQKVSCADSPEPGADELCGQVLLLDPEAFDPVSPDTACTEIYGGPDVLTVSGTLAGEAVDGEFTRENGCEIERFDAWVPILKKLFPDYEPGASLAP